MAWEGSDRSSRLPSDWPKIRQERLKKDGYRCVWKLPKTGARCPRGATEVDHIRPGDDHSMGNLRSLCEDHHKLKTAMDNRRAKRKIKASRFRHAEEHPGRVR